MLSEERSVDDRSVDDRGWEEDIPGRHLREYMKEMTGLGRE